MLLAQCCAGNTCSWALGTSSSESRHSECFSGQFYRSALPPSPGFSLKYSVLGSKRDAVPLAILGAAFTFALQWVAIPLVHRDAKPQHLSSVELREDSPHYSPCVPWLPRLVCVSGLRGYPPLTPDAVLRASTPVTPNFIQSGHPKP